MRWLSTEELSVVRARTNLAAATETINNQVLIGGSNGLQFTAQSSPKDTAFVMNGAISSVYADKVTLTIANCRGAWAYLNGDYSGLAAITSSSVWDYDGLLRVWLSKPAGAMSPVALTMLAERIS